VGLGRADEDCGGNGGTWLEDCKGGDLRGAGFESAGDSGGTLL